MNSDMSSHQAARFGADLAPRPREATIHALQAQGLVKEFSARSERTRVLAGTDLVVDKGETVVITGPSGSGKSTLLYCLGALMRPTSGTVLLDGEDPWQVSDRERSRMRATHIGFVFQSYHLMPDLSVLENCVLAARIAAKEPDPGRAMELFRKLGIERHAHKRPRELSGGEAQRAALARALMTRPRLLLCDEPTGNLDPRNTHRLLEILLQLRQGGEQGLLIVTHNVQVARVADRVLRLENGVLTEQEGI